MSNNSGLYSGFIEKIAISGLYGITKHPLRILYSFSVLML
jgi:hypothetical protein